MKAMRFHSYGPPEVLQLDDAPEPLPGLGDVLLDVAAAGINPLDWKIRSGTMKEVLPLDLPFIPGWDVCGTVAAVGQDVTGLGPGDKVLGMLPIGRSGAYAERICVPAEVLVAWPDGLPEDTAGALPVVALAAHQAVHLHGQLQPGMTLLVLGAAGLVGHLARQIATQVGDISILAAVRASDVEKLEGPFEAALRTDGNDLEALDRTVDLVIDTVGGPPQDQAMNSLRPDGRLVTTVQPPDQAAALARGIQAIMMMVQPDPTALAELAQSAASGTLQLPKPRVFPLTEAARAHAEGETRMYAKAVLTMDM